jgi:TyrR family helix-turn-helix protein
MPQRRRFDPWEAIRLRKEGLSERAIADRLGVSHTAIGNCLRRHGVARPASARVYPRKIDVFEAAIMKMAGHTLEEIAHRFQVSIPAVHHHLSGRPTNHNRIARERAQAGAS